MHYIMCIAALEDGEQLSELLMNVQEEMELQPLVTLDERQMHWTTGNTEIIVLLKEKVVGELGFS